jgi:hypothetical protein
MTLPDASTFVDDIGDVARSTADVDGAVGGGGAEALKAWVDVGLDDNMAAHPRRMADDARESLMFSRVVPGFFL